MTAYPPEALYQPYLAGADAVVIRTQPMGADSIAKAPRLQIVSRHGVGYDAVDVAAIAAGKHVYCEKPLAPLASDALQMTLAAEAKGVKTQVGFNYLCNPMLILARQMIAAGELGDIRGYRGLHAEDYMADPTGPFTFRHDPAGGGALADIGSHALATAEFLCGPITRVMGDCVTMIAARPDRQGARSQAYPDNWVPRFATAYVAQTNAWVQSLRTGQPCGASAWDGYVATALAEQLAQALASNAPVTFALPPRPALYDPPA